VPLGRIIAHMKEDETVTVLVVDDSVPFRAAARAVVDVAEGFVCIGEVETGEDALRAARRLHPDLVLMDVNMPGIGGCEATRRLRSELPRIVVVLMSTYDSLGVPHAAGDCGASYYLRKEEFGPDMLRSLWERFVPPKAA
jgi:DNA-binding NarL/FixJ family response regulator